MTTTQRPRVSVLMNSRNAPRFLPDAIRSVLWQSEPDLELIVCEASDDDEGARIVASFDDPRVILLRDEERLGWAHGVNVAFARSRGALVAFMAGDDIMHPRCVARMADAIDASGAGTAVVPVRAIDERGVPAGRTIRVPEEVRSERTWVRQFERNHIIFAMTRRECLPVPVIDESIRGVGGDWHLWLRLVEAATGFCYVDELLFEYRVHGASLVACEANTRTDMGAVLARFGEEAIDACYTRAGCDARTIEEARVWRAIARGRIRAALDATRAIQNARPAEPVWGFEAGTLQLLLGASGAARRELQRAVETLNAPEAWNNLGVAQYRCGDRQRARESFQRALDLLPLYRDARRNLETGIPMQVTERPLRPLDQIVR